MPHKIKLCICTQPPYDVLGSSCTCVAGAVGFCNHATCIALMYLIIHYSMANTKKIPDEVASTSLPQLWHKPRGRQITSEPVMEMVFKKPRLSNTGITPPEAVQKPGISCSLYQAMKAPPSNQDIGSFKARLNEENSQYGLSLYMSTTTEKSVPTKVGQAPLGSYLSYQLARTEGDFSVSHNMIFPRSQSTQM